MEKLIRFLNEQKLCCMATCSDNNPRASTLEYVMVDGSMIIATEHDSVKIKNINANNKASIAVHNMPVWTVVDGAIEPASDRETEEYTKVLLERHPEFVEMLEKGYMKPFNCYKLLPTYAYITDLSSGQLLKEIIEV